MLHTYTTWWLFLTIYNFCSSWYKCLWIDNNSYWLFHRWTQMELFHFNTHITYLEDFNHSTTFHWLLLSGIICTLQDLETFSTGRHPIPPFSKKPMINCRSYFHPIATSVQPHCLLPHGTEWDCFMRDPRYLHIILLVTIPTHCNNTAWRSGVSSNKAITQRVLWRTASLLMYICQWTVNCNFTKLYHCRQTHSRL